jgi:hypothetical protein
VTVVAVGKNKEIALPRMGATDSIVIRIAGGDIPPSRHWQRLPAIVNKRSIVDSASMQCHVQVGAVALRGRGGGKCAFA